MRPRFSFAVLVVFVAVLIGCKRKPKADDDESDEELSTEDWEAHWAEECNRRLADLEAGRTKLVPAEEVMRTMKEKYAGAL